MNRLVFLNLIMPYFIFSNQTTLLDPSLTLEKKKLAILPSQNKNYQNITEKLLSVVSSQAASIGKFEVIDRSIINDILKEQQFQLSGSVIEKDIVKIGALAAAEEALIVEVIHFGQKGIPLKTDDAKKTKQEDNYNETLFSWLVKTSIKTAIEENRKPDTLQIGLQLRNNIQTSIEANIKFINIENGTLLKSIPLSASYTGGNKDASLIKVLENLTLQVRWKLKNLYMINSEIIEVNKYNITMMSGDNLGLKDGTIFEISSRDKIKTYKGRTVTIPGKSKALIKITDVGSDASTGKIIRKWKNIRPGDKAYELNNYPKITALNLSFLNNKKYEISGKLILNSFKDISPSINGYLGSIIDSRNEMNGYLGFGADLNYDIFSIFGTKYSTSLRVPALFAFRSDDKGHNVGSFFSDPSISFDWRIQVSPYKDLVFSINYTLTHVHGPWQWQKDTGKLNEEGKSITQTEPAVWNINSEPDVQPPDFYFSIGLINIIF